MSIQQMFFTGRLANATGGTISYYQNWQIHTFTSSGTFAFTSYSGNGTSIPVKFVVANGGGTGVNGNDQTDNQDGVNGGAGASGGQYGTSVGQFTAFWFSLNSHSVVVGGAGSGSSFFGVQGTTASGTPGIGGSGGSYNGQGAVGSAGGSGPDLSTNFPWLTRLAGGGGGGGGGSGEEFVGADSLGGAGGNLGGGAGGDGQQVGVNGSVNTGGGGGGGGGANGVSSGTNTGGTGGLGGSGTVIIAFQYIN